MSSRAVEADGAAALFEFSLGRGDAAVPQSTPAPGSSVALSPAAGKKSDADVAPRWRGAAFAVPGPAVITQLAEVDPEQLDERDLLALLSLWEAQAAWLAATA